MGKSTSTSNGTTKTVSIKKVNIYEGRLRMLLQLLKERNAKITIDYDLTGRPYSTIYGEVEDSEHSLKDLFQNLWYKGDGTDITDDAYYEYF